MMRLRRAAQALWCAMALGLGALPAQADSLDSLAQFLKQARSGRAEFTQTVTAPPKQGQTARTKTSTGSFVFLRPGRFRFDYQKPFPQTLVADGQTFWLYDPDIGQATARSQAQALGSTPAALIASSADLKVLQQDFTLEAAPAAEGIEWVLATPKQKETSLQSIRIGLRGQGAEVALARLEILDAFGQRSVLQFERFEVNPSSLTAAQFQFTPPAGVQVIRP